MADQKSNSDDKPTAKAEKPGETPEQSMERAQAEAAKEREEEGGYQ